MQSFLLLYLVAFNCKHKKSYDSVGFYAVSLLESEFPTWNCKILHVALRSLKICTLWKTVESWMLPECFIEKFEVYFAYKLYFFSNNFDGQHLVQILTYCLFKCLGLLVHVFLYHYLPSFNYILFYIFFEICWNIYPFDYFFNRGYLGIKGIPSKMRHRSESFWNEACINHAEAAIVSRGSRIAPTLGVSDRVKIADRSNLVHWLVGGSVIRPLKP